MSKITVTVPAEVKDVVPGYLERAAGNVQALRAALAEGNFDEVRRIGHNYKGSGGGYGFDEITRVGGNIEAAAKAADSEAADAAIRDFADFLERVEVQ